MNVTYTVVPCRLGQLLVGATEHGICSVRLGSSKRSLVADLKREFPNGRLNASHPKLEVWVKHLTDLVDGKAKDRRVPLDIQGTPFQRRVWEALSAVPSGSTQSYKEIAQRIGDPKAVRAVARACAANPVALLIPCHRIVRSDGSLGGYAGGLERKRALLAGEASMPVRA